MAKKILKCSLVLLPNNAGYFQGNIALHCIFYLPVGHKMKI